MKKILILILCGAFYLQASANNVVISNVSILNNVPGIIQVQFDITWDNSWRLATGQANYDGAWVFFRYRGTDSLWKPMYLTGNNNSIPFGSEIYQTTDLQKIGTMIYRSSANQGTGSITFTGVRLGVFSTLPYDIDLKGFALETVFIPSAGTTRLFLGDGNGITESVNAFHYTDNTATTSSNLQMRADVNGNDDTELETDGIFVYTNDTIQLTNPIGTLEPFPTMKSLWCMKYELSQAAYRDFLNTLTYTQQAIRTNDPPDSAIGSTVLPTTGASANSYYRNHIEIKTPGINPGTPAVYGCDASNNNIYDEANDGEWVACDYLSWPDVAAYLNWCGLAPMTEIQYEHICRGVTSAGAQPAILGEFAWGNNNIFDSILVLQSPSTTSEIASNATSVPAKGNATWSLTFPSFPQFGPVRNGAFATASSNRSNSGASFYGVMEMSGNMHEFCVTIGSNAGRSTKYLPNGNGVLSSAGNAALVSGPGFWPGMEGNVSPAVANTCTGSCEVTGTAGIILRGGGWFSTPSSQLAVSYRGHSIPVVTRQADYGGRGVLYIR